MSIGRTTQISLAVLFLGAALPGGMALSARKAPRSIALSPAATPATAASTAATSRIARQSSLARHSRCDAPPASPLSYHWPVKPFSRQHPIRGYFGDPRTPTAASSFYSPASPGTFNFHAGVDIVTKTGTPVYPVVSGVASAGSDNVIVDTADGRRFQYYHIRPQIQSGDYVSAYKTVLGKTQPRFGHLHLTEIYHGAIYNPLDPGHLEPYRDKTVPVVDAVNFINKQRKKVDPLGLKGSVEISVDAHDMPARPIVADWPGLGVTPALVEWELRTSSGTVVIPRRKARDFRQTEPSNGEFWTFYGVGTHQNKYGEHFPARVPLIGRYVFKLAPSALETGTIANGSYTLRITVADTCGNSGSLSEQITIAN
jgi:murein DD-endopeptidase MepM/ murein hydrolase activator NlpD